jgi:hypothetical protein
VCLIFNSATTFAYATEQNNNQIFKDVSPKDWFYESVVQSVNENIFFGTNKDIFSPNDSMTRAMYVTIMGRIAQMDANDSMGHVSFTDLKANAYYVPYVIWVSVNRSTH